MKPFQTKMNKRTGETLTLLVLIIFHKNKRGYLPVVPLFIQKLSKLNTDNTFKELSIKTSKR